jgi:hypothetical protein
MIMINDVFDDIVVNPIHGLQRVWKTWENNREAILVPGPRRMSTIVYGVLRGLLYIKK